MQYNLKIPKTEIVEYNTQRQQILLKEYGRNIQCMVENLIKIEDRTRRNEQVKGLVEVLKSLIQPGLKENIDIHHKVWDDIFIMSNFKLDVDSPFEIPNESIINKRPQKLQYSLQNPFFRHYGKNVELLAEQIEKIENTEEKDNAILYLSRLMKNFYLQYSKDHVEDYVIRDQLLRLSKGKLSFDLEKVKQENLLDLSERERRPAAAQNSEISFKRNSTSASHGGVSNTYRSNGGTNNGTNNANNSNRNQGKNRHFQKRKSV